jgi:hypothetical protein
MSWAKDLIGPLSRGETVQCRPQGRSMEPLIPSGSLCTIAHISPGLVTTSHIVLVTCDSGTYLHRVGAIAYVGEYETWFRIENAAGNINGWVRSDKIHGALWRVEL